MVASLFDAPIPGQSLTREMGSAPFEMPPQYTDVNEALEYIFDKLTRPREVVKLVLVLKKGMPVEYLARALLFEGFAKGKWTPDMGMLMLRIVMGMMIAIAVQKGVNPKLFNPDNAYNEFLDDFLDLAEEPKEKEEPEEKEEIEFTGLMGVKL